MKNVNAAPQAIHQRNVPLSIKIGSEQKASLAQIAKEKERSMHFILCQAVKEYIDREQAKFDFYATAKKAGEHYRKTGLHTTHEEMLAWANSLGSNNELTPPTCHK